MIGLHITFGTYGFWLPNDPRGSGSHIVWAPHLLEYGPATGLNERRESRANTPHDSKQRLAAKKALMREPVLFSGEQALAVGLGFGEACAEKGPAVWACCVLPNHIHIVVASHVYHHEFLTGRLKGFATKKLREKGLHPFEHLAKPGELPPKCWQGKGWTVFLNTPADVRTRIKYVEENPLKEGKKRQHWPFVVPFMG